jgi:hypothetical protein
LQAAAQAAEQARDTAKAQLAALQMDADAVTRNLDESRSQAASPPKSASPVARSSSSSGPRARRGVGRTGRADAFFLWGSNAHIPIAPDGRGQHGREGKLALWYSEGPLFYKRPNVAETRRTIALLRRARLRNRERCAGPCGRPSERWRSGWDGEFESPLLLRRVLCASICDNSLELAGSIAKRLQRNGRSSALSDFVRGNSLKVQRAQRGGRWQQPEGHSPKHKARRRGPGRQNQ